MREREQEFFDNLDESSDDELTTEAN